MTTESARHSVLADEQRDAGRRRILTATRRMLAERGFSVTVEEVARAAEVGRRTVFRYFASRDALLAAALEDWLHDYVTRLPASPEPGQDPRDWLTALALQVQVLHVELGDLFWEIHGRGSRLAQTNEDLFNTLAKVRAETRTKYAIDAWRAFGGAGDPPDWVVDAFAVALSSYTTNRLLELGRTATQIGEVMAATLEAVLTKALADG